LHRQEPMVPKGRRACSYQLYWCIGKRPSEMVKFVSSGFTTLDGGGVKTSTYIFRGTFCLGHTMCNML